MGPEQRNVCLFCFLTFELNTQENTAQVTSAFAEGGVEKNAFMVYFLEGSALPASLLEAGASFRHAQHDPQTRKLSCLQCSCLLLYG